MNVLTLIKAGVPSQSTGNLFGRTKNKNINSLNSREVLNVYEGNNEFNSQMGKKKNP